LAKFAVEHGASVPKITLYERSSYVGGRSTTVNAYDDPAEPVELGASIFVQVNQILVNAAKGFNLSFTDDLHANARADAPLLGVWDGTQFVITQYAESTWWNTAKLLWRYGWAPVRTNNLMKAVVAKFTQMYDKPQFPWQSLSQAAYDLGLVAVTASTGEQYAQEHNIGELFRREIIQASTRVNYAQNLPHIHGLEAMVCMATDGAMAIQGGNWHIFDNMIRAASARLRLNTAVSKLERASNGTWLVHSADQSKQDPSNPQGVESFDEVVIAGPHQYSDVQIDPSPDHIPDEIPYVQLHVTLFTSPHPLAPSAFGLAEGGSVPSIILTTLPPDEHAYSGNQSVGSPGFFSISTLRKIRNRNTSTIQNEYLYKVFSAAPVNETFFSRVLGLSPEAVPSLGILENGNTKSHDITWIYRKIWHSYPYEYPRVTFEPLLLHRNLWYTGGMDSFISTMETNALMGKNIAGLILNQWAYGESGKRQATHEDNGYLGAKQANNYPDQLVLGAEL
jgi:prenylcysteine oxidase / farnesylcysteine lyase